MKTCSLPFLAAKTVSLQCELFFGVELPSPLMINASDEIVTMVLGLRTSAHIFTQLQAKEGVIHVKICFVNGIDCLLCVVSNFTCVFFSFLVVAPVRLSPQSGVPHIFHPSLKSGSETASKNINFCLQHI